MPPPIAYLEGVDLVTEGVIIVNRVVEYAKDCIGENQHYEAWSNGKDGASMISGLLFEETTDNQLLCGQGRQSHPPEPRSTHQFQHQNESGAGIGRDTQKDGEAYQSQLLLKEETCVNSIPRYNT